jgi:hypothetical protein
MFQIGLILSFVILCLIGLYFFYKFAKSVGAKEATLNTLNDSLKREEVKRNEYIKNATRISEEIPPLKLTTSLDRSLASQLLSGKVYRNKNPKT